MMTGLRRKALTISAVVILVLAALALKVHLAGSAAMKRGEAAMKAGDLLGAQQHLLEAGRWYLPGNGIRDRAAVHLMDLAAIHDASEDYKAAVAAWDDARAVYYATASLAAPGGEHLDRANRGMADSLARWRIKRDQGGDEDQLRDIYMARLTAWDAPAPWLSVLMGLALLAWLGTTATLAWRWDGLTHKWAWCAAAGTCFVLWLGALAAM